MEFQSFKALKNTWTRQLTYPSHFFKSSTMPQATNLISIDDSMQAEALGSACWVPIIGTINILLIVLDRTIQNRKKGRRSLLSMKHIQ